MTGVGLSDISEMMIGSVGVPQVFQTNGTTDSFPSVLHDARSHILHHKTRPVYNRIRRVNAGMAVFLTHSIRYCLGHVHRCPSTLEKLPWELARTKMIKMTPHKFEKRITVPPGIGIEAASSKSPKNTMKRHAKTMVKSGFGAPTKIPLVD